MAEHGNVELPFEKKTLKRTLGVFDLFAIGYGDLGSSIYYALGATALFSLGATPISFMLAGFLFICTALTYAEMASTFPESGGSAAFSRYAFNDVISFIAGWALLLDYVITIAISAFTIPPYLSHLFSIMGVGFLNEVHNQIILSIIFIGLLFLLNLRGARESTVPSFILSVLTLFSQLVIIVVVGFVALNITKVISHLKIGVPNDPFSPTWDQFLKGTAMAMVAYTGIESIAQLSAETKNPVKVIPKAIKLTMATLVVLYLGISFVAFSTVSPQDLGTKYIDNPISGILSGFPFGETYLRPWIGIIAAIILFIASNAGLMGASRLTFWMSQYYQIPRFFYSLHGKYKTPYIALAFFAILASSVIALSGGKLLLLADLYNFGVMIAFLSAHLSLIVIRIKDPTLHRPFRAPLNIPFGKYRIPLTAVIGAIGTLSVWILVVVTKPDGRNLGFIWMAFGLGIYFFYRFKKRYAKPAKFIKVEETKLDFEPVKYKKIIAATRGGIQTETVQIACELAKMHNAKLTIVHVITIPQYLPFDALLISRTKSGETALQRAEAISQQFHIPVELKLVRSRSLEKALLHLIKEQNADLVIMGGTKVKSESVQNIEKMLHLFPCKVWICRSQ